MRFKEKGKKKQNIESTKVTNTHAISHKTTTMTILRPVTTKSPSSTAVLEDSGLPFSFVVTPFAHRSAVSKGDDDKFNLKKEKKEKGSKRDTSRKSAFPTKASLIAKCIYCGSPLNSTCRFVEHWTVLCNICGKTYEADYDTQSTARMQANKYLMDDDLDEIRQSNEEAEYRSRYGGDSRQEECVKALIEYSLPLLSVTNPATQRQEEVYSLPSQLCPPLLAIFIDGTSSDAEYYNRISSCLNQLFSADSQEYKSTRVGIFVMTKNGGLSVFDLTNPGGHLKHLWVDSCPLELNKQYSKGGNEQLTEEDYNVASLAQVMTAEQIFAPLDSDYGRSCVENAIRELADSTIAIQQACQRNNNNDEFGGVYLGSTLQYFLEFMEKVAYHPGEMQRTNANDAADDDAPTDASHKFMYTGGKIMCFLSGAPDEIGEVVVDDRNGRIGTGGFGGSCAEVGKRFGATGKNEVPAGSKQNGDLEDIEAGGASPAVNGKGSHPDVLAGAADVLPQTKYVGVDVYYQDLGVACAISAFGVEIFALLTNDSDDAKEEAYIGIPLLRLLADRSGGCGPLITTLPSYGTNHVDTANDILMNEILARSPWGRLVNICLLWDVLYTMPGWIRSTFISSEYADLQHLVPCYDSGSRHHYASILRQNLHRGDRRRKPRIN